MRKLTVFLIGVGIAMNTGAQSSPDPTQDLRSAFQREHRFLVVQKENLQRQSTEAEGRHRLQLKKLQAEVRELEKKVVNLTTENDTAFAKLQELNQEKKIQMTRDNSMASTLKKAMKQIDEVERSLRFEGPAKIEPTMPETLNYQSFIPIRDQALDLLRRSSQTEDLRLGYLDAQGQLTEGEVRRYGRIAAHVLGSADERRVLGPDGKGQLQVVDVTQAGRSLLPVYLFENLTQVAQVRKPATWAERLADLVPLTFLLLMFGLVAGLFAVFVRE